MERKAQAQRRKRVSNLRRRVLTALALVTVLGGIWFWADYKDRQLPGERVRVAGKYHILSGQAAPRSAYTSDPPTSGPHWPEMATWGTYRNPLPKELLVHNLEDGGVVIYYRPGLEENQLTRLEELAGIHPKVIVAPYPDLSSRIVLTAWGRIAFLDDLDGQAIRAFVRAFAGIDHH